MQNKYRYMMAIATIATMSILLSTSLNTASAEKDQMHTMDSMVFKMPATFGQLSEDEVEQLQMKGYNVVEHNLTGTSVQLPMLGHTAENPKTYYAMTFNGQVPGPTLRVNQGDIVKMTLCIPEDENTPHSVDQHSSEMSATQFGTVNIGDCFTYSYIAQYAGVFKYHCEGIGLADMDRHVLSGMFGVIIVDPVDGYKNLMVERMVLEDGEVEKERYFYQPAALEFQLSYGQQYIDENGMFDRAAMFKHQQSAHTVNGLAFGYVPNETHNDLVNGDANKNIFLAQPWNSADLNQLQSQLMFAEEGQHVRLFVENQGNEPLYFHIVGEILDRVVQANRVQALGQDTHLIGGSQGVVIDVIFDEPGVYAAVNHDYTAIYQGAASLFVVGDFFGLNEQLGTDAKSYAELLGNPSDAIPPYGDQSIEHPMINVHGLYTDERAEEIRNMIDNGSLLVAPFN
jgi:nitrite reductase (NO-forming)